MRGRCREHSSLVPGLIGAIGKCTTRRGRAFSTIMSTETGTARVAVSVRSLAPRGVRTCRGTRKTINDTLDQLLTIARGCPRLGTGRGFGRLRTRLRKARGHVDMRHHGFGRATHRCGADVHHFPGGVITDVFNFRGHPCFRTRRSDRGTPRIGFWPALFAVGQASLFKVLFLLTATFDALQTRKCGMRRIPVMRLRSQAQCIDGPSKVLDRTTMTMVSAALFTLRRGANVRAIIMTMQRVGNNSYFSFTCRLKRGGKMNRGNGSGKLIVLLIARREYVRFTAKCKLRNVLPSTVYGHVRAHCVGPCLDGNS